MSQRNNTIDIFRYVCAILVVAVHTSPFMDINKNLGYICTEVLPRIAVPFFFTTSGYFYIRSLAKSNDAFQSYLVKTLKVYFLWSCLYFTIAFIQWGYLDLKGFITNSIYAFVLAGSHYHFWFFPALIYSVCVVTLFYKLNLKKALVPVSILLYIVGCLGCSYRSLGDTIPGMSWLYRLGSFTEIRRILLMGFPFFVSGILVEKARSYIESKKIATPKQCAWLAVLGLLWVLEIVAVSVFRWQENIIITLWLYPLTVGVMAFLLLHPMPNMKSIASGCRVMADFTYYAHPAVILLIQWIFAIVQKDITQTLLFFITLLITGILAVVWERFNKLYCSCFRSK